MSEQPSAENEELVIIRRRSAFNQAEHKGGVWKIAYADFMTAMMAFFLVMWLINATNQEARESIASYFNPVKLAETTPEKKGLDDPTRKEPIPPSDKELPGTESPPPSPPAPQPITTRPPETPSQLRAPRFDEAALFRDPYAILTDIAGGPAIKTRREPRVGSSLAKPDRDNGENGQAYRDPFDPIYWQMAPQASTDQRIARSGDRGSLPIDEDLAALGSGEPKRPSAGQLDVAAGSGRPLRPANDAPPVAAGGTQGANGTASADRADNPSIMPEHLAKGRQPDDDIGAPPPSVPSASEKTLPADQIAKVTLAKDGLSKDAAPANGASERTTNARDAAAAALQAAVRAALALALKPGPVVEVQATDEGLLVSLTDAANFGMFAIGSAEPQPELVHAMDKIAPLLAGHQGSIIVRGHTDGRPFRSNNYDNWRLSTSRAHMAYHMLVRGGIAPQRIERIEGYADRRLRKSDDPLAAQNRRIELLIKERLS